MTAKIIQSQKIQCDKCKSHYKFFSKSEQLCSNKLINLLNWYFAVLSAIVFVTAAALVLDAYLKCEGAKNGDPDEAYQNFIFNRN